MFAVARSCAISPAACQVVPAGQLLAFQQHDVRPAQFRQVVGDGTADDAAADDDDAGMGGQVRHDVGSGLLRRGFGSPCDPTEARGHSPLSLGPMAHPLALPQGI